MSFAKIHSFFLLIILLSPQLIAADAAKKVASRPPSAKAARQELEGTVHATRLPEYFSNYIALKKATAVDALLDELPFLIESRTPQPNDEGQWFRSATPLILAAAQGKTDLCTLLVQRGAYLEAEELLSGNSALNLAAMYGRSDGVRLLLQVGADPKHRAVRGLSPLGVAYWGLDHLCQEEGPGWTPAPPNDREVVIQLLTSAGSTPPKRRWKADIRPATQAVPPIAK
jgi:hypothetical protein